MKMVCFSQKCNNTIQEHNYVDSSLDPNFREDNSYLASCRGIRPDYRTTQCVNCGKISTWDFATD